MKYLCFYFLSLFGSIYCQEKGSPIKSLKRSHLYLATLTAPLLSEQEINGIKCQFNEIFQALNNDILAYTKPDKIQTHLDKWAELKTDTFNMQVSDIKCIVITAKTAQELARKSAVAQAKDTASRSSAQVQCADAADGCLVVQNYITAQLNYQKICDFLGIIP